MTDRQTDRQTECYDNKAHSLRCERNATKLSMLFIDVLDSNMKPHIGQAFLTNSRNES